MDEKLYLVCEPCGEAFDSIETAAAHDCRDIDPPSFVIRPESEAM